MMNQSQDTNQSTNAQAPGQPLPPPQTQQQWPQQQQQQQQWPGQTPGYDQQAYPPQPLPSYYIPLVMKIIGVLLTGFGIIMLAFITNEITFKVDDMDDSAVFEVDLKGYTLSMFIIGIGFIVGRLGGALSDLPQFSTNRA